MKKSKIRNIERRGIYKLLARTEVIDLDDPFTEIDELMAFLTKQFNFEHKMVYVLRQPRKLDFAEPVTYLLSIYAGRGETSYTIVQFLNQGEVQKLRLILFPGEGPLTIAFCSMVLGIPISVGLVYLFSISLFVLSIIIFWFILIIYTWKHVFEDRNMLLHFLKAQLNNTEKNPVEI